VRDGWGYPGLLWLADARKRQKQIPFGDDNKKRKRQRQRQNAGVLRYAQNDKQKQKQKLREKRKPGRSESQIVSGRGRRFLYPRLELVDGEGYGFDVGDGSTGGGYGVRVDSRLRSAGVDGRALFDAARGGDADGEEKGEETRSSESEFAEAAAA
jgi:hypothetical protein